MKQIKYTSLALLALLVVFMTLKLTNIICWSWWWVMSPVWVPAAIAVGFLIYIIIYIWLHPDELDGARNFSVESNPLNNNNIP